MVCRTGASTTGSVCDEGFSAVNDSNAGRLMHYLFRRPPWPPDPPDPLILLPLKMLLKMLLPLLLPAMPACDACLRCLLVMLRDLAPRRGC